MDFSFLAEFVSNVKWLVPLAVMGTQLLLIWLAIGFVSDR